MTATQDLIDTLTLLKGSPVDATLSLKVGQAFVFAYPSEWRSLVEAKGYVIETQSPEDPLSVGTMAGDIFTPIANGLLNTGIAIHAMNRMSWFAKHITRSQWKLRETSGLAGDTAAEAAARADVTANVTADAVANDGRSL